MDSSVSIGVFLPFKELRNKEIKKLNELYRWSKKFNIEKTVLALPELKDSFKKELRDLIGDKKNMFLVFEEGKEDFFNKIKSILKQIREGEIEVNEIDEEYINSLFDKPSHLDLIIKFGDKKLPNNFIWEKSYSELFFIEDLDEINENRFSEILKEFKERDRRFGE